MRFLERACEGIDFSLLVIPGVSGPIEILVILLVVLLLFGNRLPGVARSMGQGLIEFKRGLREPEEAPPEDEVEAQHLEVDRSTG